MINCPRCAHPMNLETRTFDPLGPLGPLEPPTPRTRYHCPRCGHTLALPENMPADTAPDNVIALADFQPHVVRETMCWRCGHRWIAVHPENTHLKELECPGCHAQGYAFATGQIIPNDILPEEVQTDG